MKYLYLIIIFFSNNIFAQTFTVSGYITDTQTGEKLIGANIYNPENFKGTASNNYGFFSFSTQKQKLKLTCSFVGYKSQTIDITLPVDTFVNIKLNPTIELNEVVVIDNKMENELRNSQMSVMELPIKELKQLPVLFGETDVLRTLQLLPGVHTGGEGTSGLFVRGGSADQNLILLDGIQIYNAYHLFGFFSVVNTDAIKNIKLYKGAFPAEYGGRISSILDIRMKEGNNKKLKGSVSLGLIAATFMLEGPIVNKNTSYIITARRTYIDAISQPFIRTFSSGGAGYYFYDLTGKINHRFSDKSRIYLSTYMGKDNFYSDYNDDEDTYKQSSSSSLNWANYTAALRWNYIFSNKLFSNTSVAYSKYKYLTSQENNEESKDNNQTEYFNYSYIYDSGIEDITGKIDFEYMPNPAITIKFGGKYIYHTFKPGVSVNKINTNFTIASNVDTTYGNQNIYAHEVAGYIDNIFDITDKLSASVGLRYSGFMVQEKYYQAVEPRASLRFSVNQKLSLKSSYSVMTQYLHLLTNTSSSMPTDLWLPVTDSVKPVYSTQYALGAVYNFNKKFNITVEAYYKTMDNLIEYAEGASFYNGFTNWEDMIETGKGWSYGIELLVKKQFGKTTGWLSYTLSKTERQFENINFGEPFPYKYDRRHDFTIAVTHKLKDNIDISATWVYGTGNAFTMPHSQILSAPNAFFGYFSDSAIKNLYHFEERNSNRMPANHRLDIGIAFHKQKKHGIRTWSLGVYNVYNRKNPFYLDYNAKTKKLEGICIFPILPYFNYKFEF